VCNNWTAALSKSAKPVAGERRRAITARQTALAAAKAIRAGGYANLVVADLLSETSLTSVDTRFVTELVYGAARHQGTLDAVIEAASGRALTSLQPGVVDVLRLGAEQILKMRVPVHAGVAESVELARTQIGARVTGVVNAILRRVAARDWAGWIEVLSQGRSEFARLGLDTCHPDWIVQAYQEVLPADELRAALEANNVAPTPTLVVRPTLMTREELLTHGGTPTPYSRWGVRREGNPGDVPAVRQGRAGVQDEGSQMVVDLLNQVDAAEGPWADVCAGPGGKAALLMGLARARSAPFLAAELHPHRARLVASALSAYGSTPVVVADARTPAWCGDFGRILVDAPCTGLGALRRRPEARWVKRASDVAQLRQLQIDLLRAGLDRTTSSGVVAYVTCSPHRGETADVVAAVLADQTADLINAPALIPDVPMARASTDPRFIQLWPHRHDTDAMFCALLRRR
jgi:16S rRNA (cytosine967-C5)-methyltransferase